ncbi:hypothetical protein Taro_016482 [Colocasia esculenta]|uniref:Uncharacterized protein n=1 Tax=Colocasia esculenta TaxID=4460 RepID=A0A843UT25_COLES|nr:hypothetical protein [Colocasia esculenta]
MCAGVGRQPFWGFLKGVPCVLVPAGLVVTVTWDPQPRASIRGSFPGGGRAQVTDLEKKGKTTPDYCFSNPFLGAVRGCTGVCSSLTSLSVRGAGWFCLWALNLVERVCAEGCFRIVFDSAGFAGVMLGPTLVVGHGISLFRYFVVLCGTCYPYRALFARLTPLLSSGRDSLSWLAFQQGPGVSCRRVLLLLLSARAASVVVVFAHAAVGFVLGLRILVVVSRRLREPTCGVTFIGARLYSAEPVEGVLALLESARLLELSRCFVCRVAPLVERCDTCLWLLSALCWLVVNSGEVLPEFFSVGSGGGLRYAAVELAVAFWWVFPERRLGGPGGERLLALWVEVLPKLPCGSVPCVQCEAAPGVLLFGLLVQASFRCVFFLCLSCDLEALVAVGRVALPTCGGRSGALQSFSVGLESFQAIGAVAYCTLSVVLPVSRVVLAVGANVLHLAEFWCLWWHPLLVLKWFVFVPSGALVALSVALVVAVSESFPLALGICRCLELSGLANLRHLPWFCLCACTCGACGLAFCGSTVVVCPYRTMRMIWVRSSGAGGHCPAHRGFSMCVFSAWFWVIIKKLSFGLAVVFLVGLVRAAPVELSTSDCVLCAGWCALCELSDVRLGTLFVAGVMVVTTGKSWYNLVVPLHLLLFSRPEWQAWQTDLSGCHGVPWGHVLVAVWAAVALRLSSSFSFSGVWSLVAVPAARGGAADGEERGGGGRGVVKALWGVSSPFSAFSMLPSPWCVNVVGVGDPGMKHPGGRPSVSCRDSLVVATRFPVATRLLLRLPYPSLWYRDGIGGREKTCVASGVFVAAVGVSVWAPGQALEGLSVRQVVIVTWDSQPRASVRGSSMGGGRAQVTDLEQKGKMVVTTA